MEEACVRLWKRKRERTKLTIMIIVPAWRKGKSWHARETVSLSPSLSLSFFNPLRANTKRLDEYQCVDNIRGVLFHETDDWLFFMEVEESKESEDKGWPLFRYFLFDATLDKFYRFKTFVRSLT